MSKMLKGSFELMKQLNISAVLNVIRNNGSLSRAEIAKLTSLTPASVTNITKALIDDDYLIESRLGESSGGRPPIMLELNPNAKFIIGVNIAVGYLEVVLTNLSAKILKKKSVKITEENINKDFVFNKLIKLINEVVESSKIDSSKILGIGVAMHGVVNANTGISEYAPYYGWTKVNVKDEIEEKLDLPVFVDNDVRAMALGESLFGVSKGISNFVTINISNGIGAGIIIDNKPYYGVDFSAGEIGHVVVEADGSKCNCGNYGCLETVASNNNIVRKFIKALKQGAESILLTNIENINKITIDDICNAAKVGDNLAISALNEAARYIGVAVTNMVNILNPKEIVVVGEIFEETEYAIKTLEAIVKRRGLKLPTEKVRIRKTSLGKDAADIGAVTLVIKEIFNGSTLM